MRAGVARWIRLTAGVITAVMVTTIVMTAVVVAIIAIAVERIAAACRLAMFIATRRRRLPASAVPVQTARIALPQTSALVRMPPLRWAPVVAIPVVAAAVLIPQVQRNARHVDIDGHIGLRRQRQRQRQRQRDTHQQQDFFSFYLLTLFFLLQWLYQRIYLTTISSIPIFRSFSTALHNPYTVCRRL